MLHFKAPTPESANCERCTFFRKRGAWASTLIASLELAKQGDVTLAQADPFTVVYVTPEPAEPPA